MREVRLALRILTAGAVPSFYFTTREASRQRFRFGLSPLRLARLQTKLQTNDAAQHDMGHNKLRSLERKYRTGTYA